MKKILLGAVLALLTAMAAAERGDANQKAVIKSVTIDIDQATQTSVLTGNVTMDKGTMRMTADKAVLKESPEGYLGLVLTSAGKSATFRQKRDGGPDLWVDGQADRVEYDERTQVVKLFGNARIRQLKGDKVTNQLDGDFITYDSRMEQLVSRNGAGAPGKDSDGRSTLVIEPKRQAPAAPNPAAGKQ